MDLEEREYIHQTNSNMEHIIIESKIDESIPETCNMSTCSVGSAEKWFACSSCIEVEGWPRHDRLAFLELLFKQYLQRI